MINQINLKINEKKDEIIKFSLELVKELSETPPGNETGVARLIKKQASIWGLPEPEILSAKENRLNLIFTLKGKKSGKVLILNGHIDTKPIGIASDWKVIDPYNPEIIKGRLYGLGATDMKGGVAAILAAAMAIKECNISFDGDILLLFAADEEGGGVYGAKVLIENGIKGDAMIIAEPSGENTDFDALALACKGAVLGKIVVHGTQMHSSLSDRGNCINASVKMAEVLVEFATNLKSNLHYKPHPLYPNGPTINPGVILEGGVFYGVVPGIASFAFDLRIIPGMTLKDVKKDIEEFLKNLMKKDKNLHVELVLEKRINYWAPAVEISRDHPLVVSCIKAARDVVGFEPKLVGAPFATDGVFFVKAGVDIQIIPSFGPGLIKLAHGPDEYVNVEAITDAAKIFAIASVDYLKS